MQQPQFVFASLELAEAGLKEYADWADEPINIISIAYGRNGIEYQYRPKRETVGTKSIVATAYPRTR